jgi:hypothetical protein
MLLGHEGKPEVVTDAQDWDRRCLSGIQKVESSVDYGKSPHMDRVLKAAPNHRHS